MLNARTVLIVCGVCASVLALAPNRVRHVPPVRTVYGRVVQVDARTPVEGVAAYFSGIKVGMVTGKRGQYWLDSVPVGATELTFTHPCYFAVRVSIPAGGDVSVSIGLPFDQASLKRPGCGGLGARSPDSGSAAPRNPNF
jgi:hypothetical protein